MSDNSIFMRVDEVAKVLDVSESYAYKIIKKLNKELAEKGKIVVSGRVNRKYFYKRNILSNINRRFIQPCLLSVNSIHTCMTLMSEQPKCMIPL